MTPQSEERYYRRLRRMTIASVGVVTLICLFYAVENWRGKRAWEKHQAELAAKGSSLDVASFAWKPVPLESNFFKTPLLANLGTKPKIPPVSKRRVGAPPDGPLWRTVGGTSSTGFGVPWRGQRTDFKIGVDSLKHYKFPVDETESDPAKQILKLLETGKEEMEELRSAARLPFSQFETTLDHRLDRPVPNFVILRCFSQSFTAHALASLQQGDHQTAFEDVRVVQKLADAMKTEPSLVGAMIRVAIMGLHQTVFWEGWLDGRWTDTELIEFQKYFETVNLLSDLDWALRAERASVVAFLRNSSSQDFRRALSRTWGNSKSLAEHAQELAYLAAPEGWVQQNAVSYSEVIEDFVLPHHDPKRGSLSVRRIQENETTFEKRVLRSNPYNVVVRIAVPNFTRARQTAAQNFAYVRMALLAAGLQRYHREHQKYPATLEELIPKYVSLIPVDPIEGGPFTYRPTDDGKFLLYSIGWNVTDDGGKSGQKDIEGDYVWCFPEEK